MQNVPEELREAQYHLTKDGWLVLTTLPGLDAPFVKSWPFTQLIDPRNRLEFLKEALSLGARPAEVIRIAGETGLDLAIPNCLERIGLKGHTIKRGRPPFKAKIDQTKIIKS